MAQLHESRIGVTKITSGFGLRLWVAQRFTAAVTALFSSASFNRLRDNSGFVSGYRFSDTVSPSELDAPLGAGQRESTTFYWQRSTMLGVILHCSFPVRGGWPILSE